MNFPTSIHLTILGCCRNNSKYISSIRENLLPVVAHFKSYDIHIAHNDSTDNTLSLLEQWARDDKNCSIYNFESLLYKIPKRTARIAYCRNFLLNKVDISENTWVLIIDMDDVNTVFKGFETVFNLEPQSWAALFINQDGQYYDILALRTVGDFRPLQSPKGRPALCLRTVAINWDCWEMVKNSGLPLKIARDTFIKKYQEQILPDELPIPVKSAFGGAGLYQSKYLVNCEYSTDTLCEDSMRNSQTIHPESATHTLCEHVSFHAGIAKNGGKMFILPSWLNKTPLEHLVN